VSEIIPSDHSNPLYATVENLRLATGVTHLQWAEVLRLTASEYERLKQGHSELSTPSLFSLCQYVDLSVEAILLGNVDLKAVSERFSGNHDYLPDCYQVAAFSRRRTALYFLDFVESQHGWYWRNRILRHLQVSEALFKSPDSPVNIQFMTDMMGYLKKNGFRDEDFFNVGLNSRIVNQNAPWAIELGRLGDPAQAFESLILDLMSQVERNSTYQITRLGEGQCRVESKSNVDVASALGLKHVSSREGCFQRAGALACVPGYQNLPLARVTETRCEHLGDSVCRFEVDFSNALHAHRRKTRAIH
jgi:hypothetical protein